MPVDRRAALQIGLLILAVPAQYLVSKLFTSPETQRSYAIRNLLSSAVGFKNRFLSWKAWHKWCLELIGKIHQRTPQFDGQDDLNGESPAIEVLKYKEPKGYFASSTEPRNPRPPHIQFRVGQVIKHKLWGYRGVIVGWDATAVAPEQWFRHNQPPQNKRWRAMPNYAVLVDTRDRLAPQSTYIPEENIEIISNMKILHPAIDDIFEEFDGAQYLPRPWLRALYPHD